MPVEHLDEPGEVHQGAAEAIDLVDHDDVDAAGLDVGEQPPQGRALECATGDATIVVTVRHQQPALRALAEDIGLAGLALGVEAVEGLLQALLAGFTSIDAAAQLAGCRRRQGSLLPGLGAAGAHAAARCWFLRPKKIQPFHRVPVIARATAESDWYGRPCHS